MKTTIDLPDALAAEAKAVALEQGLTMRELVIAGLRSEVARRRQVPEGAPFRLHTVGGRGLRTGVRPRDLVEMSYEP